MITSRSPYYHWEDEQITKLVEDRKALLEACKDVINEMGHYSHGAIKGCLDAIERAEKEEDASGE